MNPLLRAYRLLLRLYPRTFRDAYAGEMEEVYAEALADASVQGTSSLLGVLLREIFSLPTNLAREHLYALRSSSANLRPAAQSGLPGGTANLPLAEPPRAWQVLLAALPNLLLGILMGLQPLISAIFGPAFASLGIVNTLMAIMLGFTLVIVVPLAVWKRRQTWVASWTVMFFLISLFAINFFWENSALDPQAFQTIILALIFAFVMYYAARGSQVRGLLASLPFALAVWQPYMESTPKTIIDPFLQGVVSLGSWFMLALVAALALQSRKIGMPLALALAALAVSGALFAWLGTYQGGMQPFVEGDPSPRVTALFTVRTLLISAAILLGPQLARCLRQAGLTAGTLGRVSYRTALFGMVLLLVGWMIFSGESIFLPGYGYHLRDDPLVLGLITAGAALYTFGFGLVLVAIRRANEGAYWFELALLYGLIAIVPVAIFLGWPMRIDQPRIPLAVLAPTAAAWMVLSVWLIERFARKARG